MTIQVLSERGESNASLARLLGVTEGAIRYRLKRAAVGPTDGRKKRHRIEELGLQEVVEVWWSARAEGAVRPPGVDELYDFSDLADPSSRLRKAVGGTPKRLRKSLEK